MIEAQKALAIARSWDLGRASTGTEQVAVEFEILEGPDRGSSITWYGYFTENTWDRTVESLRAMGWEGDDLSQLDGLDRNQVQLVIEHEENREGKLFARVRWVNKLGGGLAMKERLEGRELSAFAARMKGLIAGKRAASGQTLRPPARSQANGSGRSHSGPPDGWQGPPPSDDDIPF